MAKVQRTKDIDNQATINYCRNSSCTLVLDRQTQTTQVTQEKTQTLSQLQITVQSRSQRSPWQPETAKTISGNPRDHHWPQTSQVSTNSTGKGQLMAISDNTRNLRQHQTTLAAPKNTGNTWQPLTT